MEFELREAAAAGDINGLYRCIRYDYHILDSIDDFPFVDTPLHTATSAGHTHFALEMMSLKPSFGKKLNPDGLSPLHLALRNMHFGSVKRLVNFDKELIRVKGRESKTPLHYVAETNEVHLLAEFLCACPAAINDQTIRDETALHIAVKNNNLEAFKVILGWLRRTYKQEIINWIDDEGNTVLHIAVSTSQLQIVKLLVDEFYMNKNAKNLEGLTPLDMAARLDPGDAIRDIENILRHVRPSESSSSPTLVEFLMSPHRGLESIIGWIFYQRKHSSILPMEVRNAILVVAVLIATASFQAILSPPGGVGGPPDHNNNNQLSTNKTDNSAERVLYDGITYGYFFSVFYFLNTICFVFSITAIIAVLPLRFSSLPLYCSLLFLMTSYGFSFYVISPSPPYSYTRYFVFGSIGSAILLYILWPFTFFIWRRVQVWIVSHLQKERFKMLQLCLESPP